MTCRCSPGEVCLACQPLALSVRAYHDATWQAGHGSLHVYLEDGNCDESSLQFCLARAEEAGDRFGSMLARWLLEKTEAERQHLYEWAHHWDTRHYEKTPQVG